MTTERKSLLTQGLEPLAEHSPRMRGLLQQLYALDDDLQDAHFLAKRDDEFGEDVVQKYKKFLAFRQIVIDELEKQKVPVPWQMRMRIDDLELTLRQREENKNGGQKGAKSATTAKKSATTKAVDTSESKKKTKKSAATSAAPPSAAEVRAVSFVAPTLVALVGALLWYIWFS